MAGQRLIQFAQALLTYCTVLLYICKDSAHGTDVFGRTCVFFARGESEACRCQLLLCAYVCVFVCVFAMRGSLPYAMRAACCKTLGVRVTAS